MKMRERSRNPLRAHLLALAMLLVPRPLWASASQVHEALSAFDGIIELATNFAGPAFVLSLAVAGYTWGLSRSDRGMRKAFNAALGFGGAAGALALGSTLGFSGAIF